MGDITRPCDEQADLTAKLRRQFRDVSCEFRGEDPVLWSPSSINPFKGMDLCAFETCGVSVNRWYPSVLPEPFLYSITEPFPKLRIE